MMDKKRIKDIHFYIINNYECPMCFCDFPVDEFATMEDVEAHLTHCLKDKPKIG